MNIYFENCTENSFVGKNSKKNLKKRIKNMYQKYPETFNQELEKVQNEYETTYLKQDKLYSNKFKTRIENNNIHVLFEYKDIPKDITKLKFKNRMDEAKRQRYAGTNRRNQINKTRHTRSDARVTNGMTKQYERACAERNNVPKPLEILDNLSEYIDGTKQYIAKIIMSQHNIQTKIQMLKSNYSLYLQMMTGVKYEDIVADVVSKVNLVQEEQEQKEQEAKKNTDDPINEESPIIYDNEKYEKFVKLQSQLEEDSENEIDDEEYGEVVEQ
jgi:hypothetical protein